MRRALLLAIVGAGRAAAAADPDAEARSFYYTDNDGLQVVTVAGRADVPVGGGALSLETMIDAVDKQAIDATSGASITTGELTKERYELAAGYAADVGGVARLRALARASHEPDYLSFSGELGGEVALAERNATLAGFIGYGHDALDPTSHAPEDTVAWPATHQRVVGGLSFSQILGPRLVAEAGAAATWQWGALSSPYRRAILLRGSGVLEHPVPDAERHPDTRGRGTAYAGASWYAGGGLALHARLGGYADTWGVAALVPEATVAFEIGERGLLVLGYQYDRQGRASFYQQTYQGAPERQTGDRRLGALDAHLGWLEIDWPISPSVTLLALFQESYFGYHGVGRGVEAHIASLGIQLK
jgi:uncharacterized protein DUF3570